MNLFFFSQREKILEKDFEKKFSPKETNFFSGENFFSSMNLVKRKEEKKVPHKLFCKLILRASYCFQFTKKNVFCFFSSKKSASVTSEILEKKKEYLAGFDIKKYVCPTYESFFPEKVFFFFFN